MRLFLHSIAIEEEATFWDTHDFTDFKQETTPVTVHSTRGLSTNVQLQLDPATDHVGLGLVVFATLVTDAHSQDLCRTFSLPPFCFLSVTSDAEPGEHLTKTEGSCQQTDTILTIY